MRRWVFALSFTLCAASGAQETARPGAEGLSSAGAPATPTRTVPKMTVGDKRDEFKAAVRAHPGGAPVSQDRSYIGDFPPYGLRKPRPAIGPSDLQH